MRKHNDTSLLASLAAPLAVAFALAAPLASAGDYNYEHFWSAKPEGTAWVTNYGECWQSLHGPSDLDPCRPPVAPVPKEFTVRLNFEFDKYRLENIVNDSELKRLDDYIAQVKQTPSEEKISLAGHTDAKGSEAYNYQLGLRRAETVQEYMVSKGIPSEDIVSVESRGKLDMLSGVDVYSVEQRRVTIKAD